MKLGKEVEDSEEHLPLYQRRNFLELKQRIALAVKEHRETPAICKGPQAEHWVIAKLLEECGLLAFEGPAGHVDVVGLKVEGDHLSFPLEAAGVEVENFPLSSHSVKITTSKIKGETGPFFVIVVETHLGEYKCLVYTYSEMKQFLQGVTVYDRSYQFSVPRVTLENDKDYEQYYEKWKKITVAVYGSE